MTKSISRVLFSHLAGFIFFLILLGVANILIPYVSNGIYGSIIQFFNDNLLLLVFIMIIGLINEIFWSFYFPFNILAPISGSVLGIYTVKFIYNLWIFLDTNYIDSQIVIPINLISKLVLILTLLIGYIIILVRHGMPVEEIEMDLEPRIKRKIIRRKRRF